MTLAGSGIAFTTTKHAVTPDEIDTVDVMRPGDRRPTVIFTGRTGGQIVGLVGGKDYLVWTSGAEQPENSSGTDPWTMYALNLRTGKMRIVADDPVGSLWPPEADMSGDRIAWADLDGEDLSDVYIDDLRDDRAPRTVLAKANTDQIAFDGESLVYNLMVSSPKRGSGVGRSDLFELNLETGVTTRLTHKGRDIELPTLAGDWLTWQVDRRLAMLNLKDRVVHRLGIELDGGDLLPGPGFAAYDAGVDNNVDLIRLVPGARPMKIHRTGDMVCGPCGIQLSGRRLVWTLNPGDGALSRRYIVHIADVTR